MSDIKIVQNTSVILDDLMAGDMSTLSREQLKNFDFNKIQLALDYLVNNENLSEAKKLHYIGNSWKIFYKRKPPTPEEFMTEEWIGPLAEHTYPRVKQTFLDFMNPTTPYRNLILYPHQGWGKTYAAMFMSLYCDTHIALMRNAKRYLGLNPASPIARAFLSFSIEKVQETLLEPFLLALENSPVYEKVHTRDGMAKREVEQAHSNQIDKIFWTTASPSSHIHISNGTQIKIVSSLHRLLGLNLVGGAVTELAHFREAGMALEINTPVLTKDGYVPMKDIKVGDILISPTGGTTSVSNIPFFDDDECYEITFSNSKKVQCNSNHLWKVSYNGKTEIVKTKFMIDNPQIRFEIEEYDL